MASRVILAVAGAGKTSYLVNELDLERRTLIVTYTNNNYENVRARVARKFSYIPNNIVMFSYFGFLHSFCYMPFLQMAQNTKGINFRSLPHRFAVGRARYVDGRGQLYSNRIAKFLGEQGVIPELKARLEKYFDRFYLDEIQDIAGNDFNLLAELVNAGPDVTFVGDYYQHTFDTSRDGSVNKNLHSDYVKYKERCEGIGLVVQDALLNKSYRCSKSVCAFITEHLGIEILSHRNDETAIALVDDQISADRIFENDEIVKLFYKESNKYSCHSANWGAVKGIDGYNHVCVVLNGESHKAYKKGTLSSLKPQTRNKLYVAITRAHGDLYFVPEKLYSKHKAD